jgi:hypothetical protein
MSELRSVIEQLRAESLAEQPDARIEEDLVELHRVGEQLEAERLRRLAELDRRRIHEPDGHLSAAAWVVRHLRVAPGRAREHVRLARGIEAMPIVRAALHDGELSLGAAQVLAQAQAAEPGAFDEVEALLVEAARRHQVTDLARVVTRWRQQVEARRVDDPDEARHPRRRLHSSVLLDGMVRVDADLDPETGEALLCSLRAVMDAEARASGARTDPRTPAQRRRCAGGDLPIMARSFGSPGGGGRAPPRDAHGGCGDASGG